MKEKLEQAKEIMRKKRNKKQMEEKQLWINYIGRMQ